MKRNILVSSLVALIILAYRDIFHVYFQQDEWVGFGQIVTTRLVDVFRHYTIFELLWGKDRVWAIPINYFLFRLAPFQSWPFAAFSLLVHSINTVLLFVIIRKLTKSTFVSYASSVFFGLSFVHQQALTWFGANVTTLPSVTFMLIALLFVLLYIQTGRNLFLFGSQAASILSLFFKESGLLLFIFLPVFYKLFSARKDALAKFWPLLVVNVFMLFMKLSVFLSPSGHVGEFVSAQSQTGLRLAVNALVYPLLSFSQVFIHPHIMFRISSWFQIIMYGFLRTNPLSQAIAENVVADLMSLIISLALLALFAVCAYKKKSRRFIVAGMLLVIVNILPYIVLQRGTSYLDSRYYYGASAGASLILAGIFTFFLTFQKEYVFAVMIISVFMAFFAYKNFQFIERELAMQTDIGSDRRNILQRAKRLRAVLPGKPVMYVTGDKNDYYGVRGLHLPFQNGPGYVFMVWYYNSGNIPKELILDNYLTDMRSSGYREVNHSGFGYFTDLKDLQTTVKRDHIARSQIVGFYYDSRNKMLTDITDKVISSVYAD